MHRRGGARSHPSIVSSGWGLSTLRLLWDISRGWTLHHSCSRRQSRRCLGTLIWRVVCGSPESARAIFGKDTGLNLGPESMPSAGANHDGKLRRAAIACGRSVQQGRIRRAAGAANVCGRSISSARMVVGAYENRGGILCCFEQLKGPLAAEEPQGAKIR